MAPPLPIRRKRQRSLSPEGFPEPQLDDGHSTHVSNVATTESEPARDSQKPQGQRPAEIKRWLAEMSLRMHPKTRDEDDGESFETGGDDLNSENENEDVDKVEQNDSDSDEQMDVYDNGQNGSREPLLGRITNQQRSDGESVSSASSLDQEHSVIYSTVPSVVLRSKGLCPPPDPGKPSWEDQKTHLLKQIRWSWADGDEKSVEDILGEHFFGNYIHSKTWKRLGALARRVELDTAKKLLTAVRLGAYAMVSAKRSGGRDMELRHMDLARVHEILDEEKESEEGYAQAAWRLEYEGRPVP